MKNWMFTLFFCCSLSLLAQEKQVVNTYSSPLRAGELLGMGEQAIKFKEVIADSRCPKNVTCVWAGEARILVELISNGKVLEEKVLVINNKPQLLNFSADEFLYSITGLKLSPYPTVENKNSEKNYVLEIEVSERLQS